MEQTNTAAVTAERPQFLTVLCIMSFIGSGLWALFSLIGVFAAEPAMELIGSGQLDTSQMTDEQVAQLAQFSESGMTEYITIACVVSLLMAGLSLLGVAKMWQLRKPGFWMYAVANGLMVIFSIMGQNYLFAALGTGFIVMYAMNLKHMA